MVNNFLSSIGSSISSVLLPPKTPTKSELHELSLSVQKATSSLEAAKLLSKNSNQLVEETTKVINQKFPDINPTEITQPPIDSSYLLRIITYSLVSCGTGPIDEYLVTNLMEQYSD